MQDGVRFSATEQELRACYQLRYKVYVEDMGRFKDMGDHDLKELKDEYDDYARAVIAVKDGITIGTLRLFWGRDKDFPPLMIDAYHLSPFLDQLKPQEICIVERLMVDKHYRGGSSTLRMYKEVMHFVLDHHIEAVLLNCEPHHLNAYLKLGFRPFTQTYSYPGIGLVIPMVLITGDYEHLQRVGSPFYMLTREEDFSHCRFVSVLQNTIAQQSSIVSQTTTSKANFLRQIYDSADPLVTTEAKIFSALNEDEIESLLEKSHIIDCKKGTHIIQKNNAAKTMFILLSGILEILRDGQLQAVIYPGDVVGEISFFLHVPRTADIIAATDNVKLLSLDEASMSRLLKFDHILANKVLMNICRNLCTRVMGTEIQQIVNKSGS